MLLQCAGLMTAGGDRLRLQGAAGGAVQETDLDGLRLKRGRKQGRLKQKEHETPNEGNRRFLHPHTKCNW